MTNTKAVVEKEKGNASFKAGNYPDAIGHYTAAMLADGKDFTLPLNRAAAYLKLGKNEDAEQDCTTVLNISALNAKALFRRGQSRIALGKLSEASSDLEQALSREPANDAIKAEISKVSDLKKKTATVTRPKVELAPPVLASAPKRRRIPITIIDTPAMAPTPTFVPSPLPSTSQSSALKALPASPSSENAGTDTMKAVSTRSLKITQSASTQPAPTPHPTILPVTSVSTTPESSKLPSIPTSSPAPSLKTEQPPTFKDAKQARENGKSSRVGGGIFRASGENTVFPSRNSSVASPPELSVKPASSPEEQGEPASISVDSVVDVLRPIAPGKTPSTLLEFTKTWDDSPSTPERWGLILSILPASLPNLFKISLEPALLISILTMFRDVLLSSRSYTAKVREYMDAFVRVERFGTLVLFLSRTEKDVAKDVWKMLGATSLEKAWKPVWV